MWFFHSLFWVVLCTLLVPKKQKTITEPCNSSEIKRGCVPLPFPVNLGSYDINSTALCNQKAQDKISALQWITNKISCVILLCFTFYTDSSNLANFRHQGQCCLQLCVYACHRLLPNNRNSHVERSIGTCLWRTTSAPSKTTIFYWISSPSNCNSRFLEFQIRQFEKCRIPLI